MRSSSPPTRLPLVHLDGSGGPVVNTVVLTAAAPSYSPDHRHLVASTVLGVPWSGGPDEMEVRRLAGGIYGTGSGGWEHIATTAVPQALCSYPAPAPDRLRRGTTLGEGLFVAGDHRDTPSIQGALVSGRRAARAVLRDLRVSPRGVLSDA